MGVAQAMVSQEPIDVFINSFQVPCRLEGINLCNTSSDPETITLHVVPCGKELGPECTIVDDLLLEPHGRNGYVHPIVLENGDRVTASAACGGRVAVTVSYRKLD
jgi:hypothetical protein